MGAQDQMFAPPQGYQSPGPLATGFPGPHMDFSQKGDGMPFDPEVMAILQGGMAGPARAGGQSGQSGGGFSNGAQSAASTAMKLYPFLGAGGSEAAIAGLGGAGSALAGGMAAGGTGAGAASATAGLAGTLPGYAAVGGPAGAGIFTGSMGAGAAGAGGAGAAGAGSAAGAGGASGAGAGLGAMAGAALPAAVLIGGLTQMFKPGTAPKDISGGWMANRNALTPENFNNYRADNPHLNGLLDLSMSGGQFDINKFNEALGRSRVGGKAFEGQALADGQQFGQMLAANPALLQGPAATMDDWQSRNYASYGGG